MTNGGKYIIKGNTVSTLEEKVSESGNKMPASVKDLVDLSETVVCKLAKRKHTTRRGKFPIDRLRSRLVVLFIFDL